MEVDGHNQKNDTKCMMTSGRWLKGQNSTTSQSAGAPKVSIESLFYTLADVEGSGVLGTKCCPQHWMKANTPGAWTRNHTMMEVVSRRAKVNNKPSNGSFENI